MNLTPDRYAGPAAIPPPATSTPPGPPAPPRYSDWISYAVAVTPRPLPSRPELLEASKF